LSIIYNSYSVFDHCFEMILNQKRKNLAGKIIFLLKKKVEKKKKKNDSETRGNLSSTLLEP